VAQFGLHLQARTDVCQCHQQVIVFAATGADVGVNRALRIAVQPDAEIDAILVRAPMRPHQRQRHRVPRRWRQPCKDRTADDFFTAALQQGQSAHIDFVNGAIAIDGHQSHRSLLVQLDVAGQLGHACSACSLKLFDLLREFGLVDLKFMQQRAIDLFACQNVPPQPGRAGDIRRVQWSMHIPSLSIEVETEGWPP
jgi:hypothetical protein